MFLISKSIELKLIVLFVIPNLNFKKLFEKSPSPEQDRHKDAMGGL